MMAQHLWVVVEEEEDMEWEDHLQVVMMMVSETLRMTFVFQF
jgi:hypothetical protein